jgi:hypothetical protein
MTWGGQCFGFKKKDSTKDLTTTQALQSTFRIINNDLGSKYNKYAKKIVQKK